MLSPALSAPQSCLLLCNIRCFVCLYALQHRSSIRLRFTHGLPQFPHPLLSSSHVAKPRKSVPRHTFDSLWAQQIARCFPLIMGHFSLVLSISYFIGIFSGCRLVHSLSWAPCRSGPPVLPPLSYDLSVDVSQQTVL
jgi:hypothetical protein